MQDSQCLLCGGCPLRTLNKEEYQAQKTAYLKKLISLLNINDVIFDNPIFIQDGLRRRAELDFCYEKKELKFGFNEQKTHNIIDISDCPMLDDELNSLIPKLKIFLKEFCCIPIQTKIKKKINTEYIKKGTIRLLNADNGIDITIILEKTPSLDHRMLIADFVNQNSNIVRVSWQIKGITPEIIVAKASPKLYIKDIEIDIPIGSFLQASKEAENQMIEKLLDYMGDTSGNIIDLFCGLGTFTYPVSKNNNNNIISIDSSKASLEGLQNALYKNQIHNVKVINKNLFKYPLEKDELKSIDAIIIDPPRAGAHEQLRCIADLNIKDKPQKIIYISCNPQTFIYDASLLIKGDYAFKRITLIDQFVYSKHLELMALFTLTPNNME